MNDAILNITTPENIAEIKSEFSRQQWPYLYYFVHGDAKRHIQLLINHIDALEAKVKSLETKLENPKCSCAMLNIHGYDSSYCKIHGEFKE